MTDRVEVMCFYWTSEWKNTFSLKEQIFKQNIYNIWNIGKHVCIVMYLNIVLHDQTKFYSKTIIRIMPLYD